MKKGCRTIHFISSLLAVVTILSKSSIGNCSDLESNLINRLLWNYQKYARPVSDPNLPLNLNITLTLKQIIDLDERNQLLKTNLWLEYYWYDDKLKWETEYYGNIKDIRIPSKRIWNPDILMYHSASEEFDSTYPVNIVVYQDGKCKYGPPAIFQSTCQINMTWFPFDEQICKLKFGSWTYPNTSINVDISDSDITDKSANYSFRYKNRDMKKYGNSSFEEWYIKELEYEPNGEWQLLDLHAVRNTVPYNYSGHVEHYIDVTYTIKLRRRTVYYFLNFIVPCGLIAIIAVWGFYLPPTSGEKVSLEITILMSLAFFMQVVRDMQPPSSQIPLISSYFTFIMIMVACSVFATILVLNYHHRLAKMDPMPFLVEKIFLQWLPWLLRLPRNGVKITRRSIHLDNMMKKLSENDTQPNTFPSNILDDSEVLTANYRSRVSSKSYDHNEYLVLDEDLTVPISNAPAVSCPIHGNFGKMETAEKRNDNTRKVFDVKEREDIRKELARIFEEICIITDKIRSEEESSSIEEDWKFAAMVLDRFCLIVFTLYTILLSAGVFMSPKHVIVY